MGGGHRRANPRKGEKGPLRGDRRREEVAGRKRIGKEYRPRGPSHFDLAEPKILEDLSRPEYRILYAVEKRKAYGYRNSTELEINLKIQGIPEEEYESFISLFGSKLTSWQWGDIYFGKDGKHYIYIFEEQIPTVRRYLNQHQP